MSDEYDLRSQIKNDLINDILNEEDLYKILGAHRNTSPSDLRRCYLDRSKIIHPDKPPFHSQSTSAFQRLGFAFEILKTPSTRHTYDTTTSRSSRHPHHTQLPTRTFFLTPSQTFQSAVATILTDFITGDFTITRRHLLTLSRRYPHLLTPSLISSVETSFLGIRDLCLKGRVYALIIYIEMGRIRRVVSELRQVGWLDVVGRTRLTFQLVRVTLAVPVRVDRALRIREERKLRREVERANANGLQQGTNGDLQLRRAGILNERVCKVLEFMVGAAGKDEGADEAWSARLEGDNL